MKLLALALATAAAAAASYSAEPAAQAHSTEDSSSVAGRTFSHLTWEDVDGDGLLDVLVLPGHGGLQLLKGTNERRLEDVTSRSGLAHLEGVSAIAMADFDGDFRLDLFIVSNRAESRLYRQNDEGSFRDVTLDVGLPAALSAFEARWLDYDLDGRLDLHVRTADSELLYRNTEGGLFEEVELDIEVQVASRWTSIDGGSGGSLPGDAGEGSGEPRPGSTPGSSTLTSGLPSPTLTSMSPGTVSPTGSPLAAVSCVASIDDLASSGSCLTASSTPTLGSLYPISNELFVDATTGRVGIGTTTPGRRLDVSGRVRASSTATDTLASTNTGNGNALHATAEGLGTAAVLDHSGNGPLLLARSGGDVVLSLGNDGGLVSTTDDTGLSQAAVVAHNTSTSSGNAIYCVSNGTATTAYVKQQGSGNIMKGDNSSGTVFRVSNTGRVVTTALEITGGGDLVEGFETSGEKLEPGTVAVIDPEVPGRLKASSGVYDRKVAGVISGAGGVNHGIRMGQDDVLDGDALLAMAGRVYVKCSTENGAIEAGDLLTTASLEGYAMKASDTERSFGAVIGKAMGALDEGTGMVLVLVNLQ